MTWGDSHYLGITGLELVGRDGQSLPLDLSMMSASPQDLNDLPGYGSDARTLDKYVPSLAFSPFRYPPSDCSIGLSTCLS